jgi:GNAT superfamily N-acetyltransferase
MRGLLSSTLARLDAFWAAEMDCHPGDFQIPGIALVEHRVIDDLDYVQLLQRGRRLQISCTPSMIGDLRDTIRGLPIESIFNPKFLGSIFGRGVMRIIGPAYLGYLDALDAAPINPNVRLLDEDDRQFLVELKQRIPVQDWEYSGLKPEQPIAGYFVDGELRSAAGYKLWGDYIAHIGVVTRPDCRSCGYARACVRKIAQQAIAVGLIALYQTLYTNKAAIIVGQALGFEHYADKIYVRATSSAF